MLALMGLKPESVSDGDSLALLGIDSMQLMEVRGLRTPALTSSPFLHPATTPGHRLNADQRDGQALAPGLVNCPCPLCTEDPWRS